MPISFFIRNHSNVYFLSLHFAFGGNHLFIHMLVDTEVITLSKGEIACYQPSLRLKSVKKKIRL